MTLFDRPLPYTLCSIRQILFLINVFSLMMLNKFERSSVAKWGWWKTPPPSPFVIGLRLSVIFYFEEFYKRSISGICQKKFLNTVVVKTMKTTFYLNFFYQAFKQHGNQKRVSNNSLCLLVNLLFEESLAEIKA